MASGTIPVIKGVNNYRTIYSGDDLNNYYGVDKGGFYYVGASAANISNCPYGFCCLLVFSLENNASFQMLFGRELYVRAYTGTNLTWSAWQKATLTQV